MWSVTVIGFLMLVGTLYFPGKADVQLQYLMQSLRFFTLCTMLCGCLTIELPENSIVPMVILCVIIILVPLVTIWRICRLPDKFNVKRFSSGQSYANAALIDGADIAQSEGMDDDGDVQLEDNGNHSSREEDKENREEDTTPHVELPIHDEEKTPDETNNRTPLLDAQSDEEKIPGPTDSTQVWQGSPKHAQATSGGKMRALFSKLRVV